MIEQLDIRDLGVIAHASLPFQPGFTVLTGETGAGKTMVVTALGLLLGERADTARVRQGADGAWVEGRFHTKGIKPVNERVDELGGVVDDGELVLARQVAGEGRSKAVVGGRAAPVSVLSELSEHLVVVHGQSEQLRLKSESAQREALDRFAGESLVDTLARYQQVFRQLETVTAELDDLVTHQQQRQAEAEHLSDAVARIEAVRPEAGEDERLRALTERLSHVEELRLAAHEAKEQLSSEQSGPESHDARSQIEQAIRALERVVDRDESLRGSLDTLREAAFHLEEANQSLSGYLAALTDGEEIDLESLMQRRAALTQLMREHGPTLDDVLQFERDASDRILQLDVSAGKREQLENEQARLQLERDELASTITNARQAAAEELARRVTEELGALAMADAQFVVQLSAREPTLSGADQVSFQLAAHRGADPRPLGRGASGGELSRVMLALEVVIAESNPVPTFIFDEVDAGVGGATALEIGRRLQRLARSAQVICVTHLAQVASCADHHLHVVKDNAGEYTESSVRVLTGEDRLTEIARMLGGDQDSESAKAHASEMLERESVSRSGHR